MSARRSRRVIPYVDAAYAYSGLGWALVPCDGKAPRGRDWQRTQPVEPDLAAGKWSQWGEHWNLGIVLGPSGLAVLDVDRDDAEEAVVELLGSLPATPTVRTGSGRLHVYYRDPGGLEKRARDGFELRVGAHQVIAPPSVHPDTGTAYAWLPGRAPEEVALAQLPPELVAYFAAEESKRGPAPEIGETIAEGARNETLVSLAGSMRRRGASEAEIRAALQVANRDRCRPPLPPEDVERRSPMHRRICAGKCAGRCTFVRGPSSAPAAPPWQPLPLSEAAAVPPPAPDRFHGLGYGGATETIVSAEPGIGKSMLLAAVVGEEARAGRTPLYLDFERTPGMLRERLELGGLSDEEIGRVFYLRPQLQASSAEIRAMVELLGPSLIVIDTYDAALAAFGRETKNEDVRAFHAYVVEPLRSLDAPMWIADHVAKNRAPVVATRSAGNRSWRRRKFISA